MKLFRKIFGVVLLIALVGVGIWLWSYKLHAINQAMPDGDSPDQRLARWRSTAQADMLAQASNDVPGFTKLIDSSVDTSGDFKTWTGEVTADYVNHVGGIDRTNLHYVFTSLQGDLFCQKTSAN
jgi:hypothetical protein